MIPNKMDILRKSYAPHVLEFLKVVATELSWAVIGPDNIPAWEHTLTVPFVTTSAERHQIKWELDHAGWGGVFKYKDAESEKLMIYLRH